jgi:hypothetical protein
MKLPKNWNKMDNEEQRQWVAKKLAEVRQDEEKLLNMLRKLVQDGKFVSRIDIRPDLETLKHE